MSKGHDRTIVLRKAGLGYHGEVAHWPGQAVESDAERKLSGAPEIVSSNPGAPIILCFSFMQRERKLTRLQCAYADGCFRMSAKACKRFASAGLFAALALCSTEGAMLCNFATLLLFMCELSAL